ncbi:sterol regulatory element-binding protein cleavage-activating protein-like [Mya arenaria]|uniref:sterol regulatory element-binding protein cleavage-activating protein-like n=1 Tax=Mya arenaria TaxID=6604 RepID=UPI0022E3341D|nr:sterol regulatory element-binding protein cleavage-activating protein-like [Mya arenaria]
MQILRSYVSRVYYTHGLFCASHPISILCTVCCVIILFCYPLIFVPWPGNIPVEYTTPLRNYQPPAVSVQKRERTFANTDVTSIPRWYQGLPVGFIQQVVVKATVSPWEPTQHDPLDALHAPLSKVFRVLEDVEKFRHTHNGKENNLVDVCLRVFEPVRGKSAEKLLPEYACLVLSPANLWQRNLKRFLSDKEVLQTVYKRYNQAYEAPPGFRDLLFGVPWPSTGVSRYFIRNRQRTITYALTIVYKTFNESYVNELSRYLESQYPDIAGNANNTEVDQIIHLHYKNINPYFEYTHLIVLYLVVLMYIYFSVKKIEMVKSKWGLALSAVVTVFSSLLMSVSICSVFGMSTQLNGSEIFPYLVVLIGMENVLVMTKSIVSTSIELDVRERVAIGLSKEGWSITKNLVIELAIIAIGFFTFVPAIQEFCLFALVGLLTDFFLQMVFFVTVLSVDIRRMELSDLQKYKKEVPPGSVGSAGLVPVVTCPFKAKLPQTRVKLQPRFNFSSGVSLLTAKGQPVSPRVQHEVRFFQRETFLDLPRRLRFVYFWASTRVVQRFIMVCSVIWIVLLVYKSGLVHHLTNSSFPTNGSVIPPSPDALEQIIKQQEQTTNGDVSRVVSPLAFFWLSEDEEVGSVRHTDVQTWRKLSPTHWLTLFSYYNISLTGKYISILPSIHLSIVISPEEAIEMRVPGYKAKVTPLKPKENNLKPKINEIQNDAKNDAQETGSEMNENVHHITEDNKYKTSSEIPTISQEPDFFSEEYLKRYYPYMDPEQLIKLYNPKSRTEFIITVSLGFLSVICITYFMMMLYRCLCTRKYSKWRASWSKMPKNARGNNYFKQIKEAVPIVLRGHLQEIECLITDGSVIISSCLGGQLRVWDSVTGECLHIMQRKSATPPMRRKPCEGRNIEDSDADLYAEYHGSHRNLEVSSSDLDLTPPDEERPQMRHRKIDEAKEKCISAEKNKETYENFPDLKSTIDTDFTRMFKTSTPESARNKPVSQDSESSSKRVSVSDNSSTSKKGVTGYDFENRFAQMYNEHEKYLDEKKQDEERSRSFEVRGNRSKSWSEGDLSGDVSMSDTSALELAPAPIWCLACRGNLIIAGCGNGKLEFWDSTSGTLKCVYGENQPGVTGISLVGHRVIAARLDGSLDFLELETFQSPKISTPLSPSSLNRKIKGHSRHMSHGRCGSDDLRLWDEAIHCNQVQRTQAHQRPITVLATEGGRIVSGSQDFTLKVFRLEDYKCLYTLHGHTGGITCLFLDKCTPYAAVSGSADGTIRLWDQLTGHCVHKVRGHEGTVVGLTCTDMYIISSGLDDKLCVWERKRGHLLYSVDMETSCGSSMAMLQNNFLVTGRQGSLYLWDVHKGELVRVVNLQQRSCIAFIHHIQAMENSTIVCDYGNEIKVIHFPLVLEKRD